MQRFSPGQQRELRGKNEYLLSSAVHDLVIRSPEHLPESFLGRVLYEEIACCVTLNIFKVL